MKDAQPDLTLIPKAYKLHIGDEVSEAYLYVPPEDPTHGKNAICEVLGTKARNAKVKLSRVRMEDVTPDDRRIPRGAAKDWPHGTRCIIGTARVIGHDFIAPDNDDMRGAEFLAKLTAEELQLLRRLTRQVARKHCQALTDAECDAIIAERGPNIAELQIAHAVAGGGK